MTSERVNLCQIALCDIPCYPGCLGKPIAIAALGASARANNDKWGDPPDGTDTERLLWRISIRGKPAVYQ